MTRVPSRVGTLAGTVAALAVVVCMTGCPPLTSGPLLSVSPSAVRFEEGVTTQNIVVSNAGTGSLTWSIGDLPDWLSVAPAGATAMVGTAVLTLTVDRAALPAGARTAQFQVLSNGGDQIVSVTVVVSAPATLSVTPDSIDFGAQQTLGQFTVRNVGGGTLNWSTSIPVGAPWVTSLSSTGGNLGANQQATVTVTIDRDDAFDEPPAELPVDLDAVLTVRAGLQEETVELSARIVGDVPQIAVSPASIDLGAQGTASSFTVRNDGRATLEWAIGGTTYVPDGAAWLTLAPVGSIDPANPENPLDPSETQGVTITADRTGLDPGAYSATVELNQIEGGEVTDTVTVTVSLSVMAPELVVVPSTLRFGSYNTEKILSVSNLGPGTIDWELDPSVTLPAWLSVDPVFGVATSTASRVTVEVDRTGVEPGSYSALLRFIGRDEDGELLEEQPEVIVTMSKLEAPALFLTGLNPSDADLEEGDPKPLVYNFNMGELRQSSFTIANSGTGYLTWLIDATGFPDWLVGISGPTSDPLSAGQSIPLTVTIDTAGLNSGPLSHQVTLDTNERDVVIVVSALVPERESIFVSPEELIIGAEEWVSAFGVANDGDLSTLLRFRITADQPSWLFFSPATGVSVSTVPLSFTDVNVAVDRYALRGIGGAGNLIISAEDELGNPREGVESETLPVSVEVSPLTFETPRAEIRQPSIARYVFSMRNIRDEAFSVPPDVLDPPGASHGVRIFEEGVLIERSETNQFVMDASKLRVNLLILLDYSASMVEAAELIFPASADPLQDVYEEALTELLVSDDPTTEEDDEAYLPVSFRIGLAEFHDRNVPVRVVHDFTEDRDLILNALDNLSVAEHGATPLLPALMDAANVLVAENALTSPYANTDLRGLIVITDGRLTTPPGDIDEVGSDFREKLGVALYAIGWGSNVNHEPLARIATDTGGHYYPTQPNANGDPYRTSLVNPGYNPVPQPVAIYPEDIRDFNDAEDAAGRVFPGKIQLLRQDLAKIMGLAYVTLNEDRGVPVRVDVGLDPLPDDGETRLIAGSLGEVTFDFEAVVGDARLGQISMRTSGIDSGSATVIMRCDYAPRNINKFRFRISCAAPIDGPPEVIPSGEGGLLEGWELTSLGSNTYELRPGADAEYAVLPYGAFGDMVRFHILPPVGMSQFFFWLLLDNSIYLDLNDDGVEDDPLPVDAKAFVYAAVLVVDPYGGEMAALPLLTLSSRAFDFGVDEDIDEDTGEEFVTLTIQNTGDTFITNAKSLDWAVTRVPDFVTVTPLSGLLDEDDSDEDLTITLDRSGSPGHHFGLLQIDYASREVGIVGTAIVNLEVTIREPILNVSTVNLDFGGATDELFLYISNPGQSTLSWTITPEGGGGLPAWLSLSTNSGTTTDVAEAILVSVDRTGLVSGTYSQNLTVDSNDVSATVTVTMLVP